MHHKPDLRARLHFCIVISLSTLSSNPGLMSGLPTSAPHLKDPLPFFVSNVSPLRPYVLLLLSSPPASSHLCRFLHCETSIDSRMVHPSTTASTPTPVTRTQPRTESSLSSRRCRPIERSEESETAEPQNASLREWSWGQPRERTSVAVSERAQQNDLG